MSRDELWIKCMEFGKILGCHQMPERSFFIKGYQFPVCARCTGVIISYFLALILFKKYKVPWQLCIIMAGIMLTDWSLQYFGIKESTNPRRFVTGLIGGFGLNTLKLKSYNFIIKQLMIFTDQKQLSKKFIFLYRSLLYRNSNR